MVYRLLSSVAGLPIRRPNDSRALSLLPGLPVLPLAVIRVLVNGSVRSAVWATEVQAIAERTWHYTERPPLIGPGVYPLLSYSVYLLQRAIPL